MKRSRFSEEQIIGMLKERRPGLRRPICAASTASAMPPSTSARRGMVVWRCRRPAGSRLWRTRTPSSRSWWPRRCSTTPSSKTSLQKMGTPDAKRDAVAHSCLAHGVSPRRVCEALDIDRSSVRYRSTILDDRELREAMKGRASQRGRFGYRRIHVMLQRQGLEMSIKKLWRLDARRSCRSASAVAASEPWARGARCSCRTGPSNAGAPTSCPTPSPTTGASGCSPSWTATRASACHLSRTPRFAAGAS